MDDRRWTMEKAEATTDDGKSIAGKVKENAQGFFTLAGRQLAETNRDRERLRESAREDLYRSYRYRIASMVSSGQKPAGQNGGCRPSAVSSSRMARMSGRFIFKASMVALPVAVIPTK